MKVEMMILRRMLVWLSGAMLLGGLAVEGADFRSGVYIRDWVVLGPVPIPVPVQVQVSPEGTVLASIEAQRAAFQTDFLIQHGGETNAAFDVGRVLPTEGGGLLWRNYISPEPTVDLGGALGFTEQCVAYAWTEVVAETPTNAILAVGAEDALKVWVNGTVLLEKWARRPLVLDEEMALVGLRRGTNHVLLKFQTGRRCQFAARLLARSDAGQLLVEAAAKGELERVRKLVTHGAAVSTVDAAGLTALLAARVHGHGKVVDYLTESGADPALPIPPAGRVIDGLMKRAVVGDSPGAMVLVGRYGRVVFESGYGLANLEHKVPITPSTVFRIGALTMPLTAAGVLILEEEGKLSVSDPVSKHLPQFPADRGITLRHLLTHTAGLGNYPNVGNAGVTTGPPDMMAMIAGQPGGTVPGDTWRFGNSGYIVLGQVLSELSGLSYSDYLRTRIAFRVGMTNTMVPKWREVVPRAATGYSYEGGKFLRAEAGDMTWLGGAGALSSSAGDLYQWSRAFFGGELLKKSTVRTALTPVRVKGVEVMSPGYGFGWFRSGFRGLELVYHEGRLDGFAGYLAHYPNQELTVVVLANAAPAPAGLNPAALANEIAQVFLYPEMSAP